MDLDSVLGKAYSRTMTEEIEKFKLKKDVMESQNKFLALSIYVLLGSLFFSKFKKNVYNILDENNKRSED